MAYSVTKEYWNTWGRIRPDILCIYTICRYHVQLFATRVPQLERKIKAFLALCLVLDTLCNIGKIQVFGRDLDQKVEAIFNGFLEAKCGDVMPTKIHWLLHMGDSLEELQKNTMLVHGTETQAGDSCGNEDHKPFAFRAICLHGPYIGHCAPEAGIVRTPSSHRSQSTKVTSSMQCRFRLRFPGLDFCSRA